MSIDIVIHQHNTRYNFNMMKPFSTQLSQVCIHIDKMYLGNGFFLWKLKSHFLKFMKQHFLYKGIYGHFCLHILFSSIHTCSNCVRTRGEKFCTDVNFNPLLASSKFDMVNYAVLNSNWPQKEIFGIFLLLFLF